MQRDSRDANVKEGERIAFLTEEEIHGDFYDMLPSLGKVSWIL